MRRVGRRVVAMSVVMLVLIAGCSSDNGSLDQSRSEGAAQIAPESVELQEEWTENVLIPAEFAGMRDYSDMGSAADLKGVLLIEGPCVYIIEELPEPTRVFVELPRDRTWYAPDTESIWSHDYGPMISGDRVLAGGGGRNGTPPDVCSADVEYVFVASHMAPIECDPGLLPERQTGCRPTDILAGMWDYNEIRPLYAPAAEGVLLIEDPCVYIIDDFAWLVPSVPIEELPEPVRVFVNLPRAQTRYDPDTESVWVRGEEPMASDDRVELAGGAGQSIPDVCSAGVARVFTATHMSPKSCVAWVPPERQSGCKPVEVP